MLPGPAPRTDGAIRWGIGDFLVAFVVGLAAAVAAVAFLPAGKLDTLDQALLLVVQDGASIAWLVLVARRKGVGTLGRDFGLTRSPASGWGSLARWIGLGVLLQLVVAKPLALLQDVHGQHATQGVVDTLEKGNGVGLVLFALAAGLVAPVAEELLFRGVLLRSLLRRFSPGTAVLIGALAFGAVHPLTDPSVGSLIAFPALVLVGLVCGHEAVRTGDLWHSIAIHVGFNVLTVIAVLAVT